MIAKRQFDGKTEIIEWKSFFNGEYKRPTKLESISIHVERNKVIYQIASTTIMLFLVSDITAFASSFDDKANLIYKSKVLMFGKWALIIKGGWSTIHKAMQEDFDGAKKSFFQYLIIYLILLAFPWAMNEADGAFT